VSEKLQFLFFSQNYKELER